MDILTRPVPMAGMWNTDYQQDIDNQQQWTPFFGSMPFHDNGSVDLPYQQASTIGNSYFPGVQSSQSDDCYAPSTVWRPDSIIMHQPQAVRPGEVFNPLYHANLASDSGSSLSAESTPAFQTAPSTSHSPKLESVPIVYEQDRKDSLTSHYSAQPSPMTTTCESEYFENRGKKRRRSTKIYKVEPESARPSAVPSPSFPPVYQRSMPPKIEKTPSNTRFLNDDHTRPRQGSAASAASAESHWTSASTAAGSSHLSAVAEKSEETTEEDEGARREKFLERNRMAASKCRAKKKEWTEEIQTRSRVLASENARLRASESMLREEVLALKGELLKHVDCDCDAIRSYLERTVNQIAKSDRSSISKSP